MFNPTLNLWSVTVARELAEEGLVIAAGPVVDLPLIKGEAIPDDVGVSAGLSINSGFEKVLSWRVALVSFNVVTS